MMSVLCVAESEDSASYSCDGEDDVAFLQCLSVHVILIAFVWNFRNAAKLYRCCRHNLNDLIRIGAKAISGVGCLPR